MSLSIVTNCSETVRKSHQGSSLSNNSNVRGCLKPIHFDSFLKLMVKNKSMSVGNGMYKVTRVVFFSLCVFQIVCSNKNLPVVRHFIV